MLSLTLLKPTYQYHALQSLETMAILRPFPRSILNKKPHPDMKAELQRLQSIDSND